MLKKITLFALVFFSFINAENTSYGELIMQRFFQVAAENTIPCVAHISTVRLVRKQSALEMMFGGEELLRRFFGIPEKSPFIELISQGTGFFITTNGYLISNYHVVEKNARISITVPGKEKEYTAKIVWSHPGFDIAILKIQQNDTFSPVILGNSDAVRIGDIVMAIGGPFGLQSTFTTGVVSAVNRRKPGSRKYERYIQSDAAINPGNSGGPLINIYNEVIGINTAIFSESGGSIGIGFSIPVNTVKELLKNKPALKEKLNLL